LPWRSSTCTHPRQRKAANNRHRIVVNTFFSSIVANYSDVYVHTGYYQKNISVEA
jgi:hypothetical protein